LKFFRDNSLKEHEDLIEVYFTSEALKKDSGIESEIVTKDVKNAAIMGAGVMGGGIAWLFANNNLNIRIKDITQKAIALGYHQIILVFNQLKKIRKITSEQANIKIGHVTASVDYAGFDQADFVIEAIVENMAVKKKLLAEVEAQISKDAVIASCNRCLRTSGLKLF
jgi:3-hydroxyacyl-CoA dehydrogenase/enoyl-CoA hydratase/3-hydroxybutyryl-CoA epimerase